MNLIDVNGNEFSVNSRVCVAHRVGNTSKLRTGIITDIIGNGPYPNIKIVWDDTQRPSGTLAYDKRRYLAL